MTNAVLNKPPFNNCEEIRCVHEIHSDDKWISKHSPFRVPTFLGMIHIVPYLNSTEFIWLTNVRLLIRAWYSVLKLPTGFIQRLINAIHSVFLWKVCLSTGPNVVIFSSSWPKTKYTWLCHSDSHDVNIFVTASCRFSTHHWSHNAFAVL